MDRVPQLGWQARVGLPPWASAQVVATVWEVLRYSRSREAGMTVTLCPDISTTDTDDGRVLLDERTGRYFQLNPSGALVLDALVNAAELAQAARLLTQRYTITHDRAVADVTALIDHLRIAGLLIP